MHSIFSLKTLQLGFLFYKKFFLTCLLITIALWSLKMSLLLIITLKFLFFGILFAAHFGPSLRQKLIFYKNFGISRTLLFTVSFLIDALITTILVLTPTQF